MSKETVVCACDACSATGDCQECGGEGVLWGDDGEREIIERCQGCDGSGCCPDCRGVGWTKFKAKEEQ